MSIRPHEINILNNVIEKAAAIDSDRLVKWAIAGVKEIQAELEAEQPPELEKLVENLPADADVIMKSAFALQLGATGDSNLTDAPEPEIKNELLGDTNLSSFSEQDFGDEDDDLDPAPLGQKYVDTEHGKELANMTAEDMAAAGYDENAVSDILKARETEQTGETNRTVSDAPAPEDNGASDPEQF